MSFNMKFIFWLGFYAFSFGFTSAGYAAPSPSSVPIYEDPLVTVYDDEPSDGTYHLAVVHKAGLSDPLFDVSVVKDKDQYGFDTVTYQLSEINVKHVALWMGDAFLDSSVRKIVVEHYLEGYVLDPAPVLSSGYGRGRPIASYSLINQNRVNSRPSQRTQGVAQRPPKWILQQAEPTSDHWQIGRSYINTFDEASKWRKDSHIEKLNQERRGRVNSLVSGSATDDLTEYGYVWADTIAHNGDRTYYLVNSDSRGRLNIVVVHDNINESDYIVDLDPLLTRSERGRFTLSYLLTEDEIKRFNQSASKALRHIDPRTTKVQIAHHIRGKTLGLVYREGVLGDTDIPVFSNEFQWHDDLNTWRPSYETPTERNASGIGRFYRSRYSLESIREYILMSNRQREDRSFLASRPPIEELYLALNRASPAVRQRWVKYALWTDAYWVFYDLPIGRQLIDGQFDRVAIDSDFRSLYVGYIQAYSDMCKDYIKNPTTIEHVYTQKEVDGYGITLNKETTRYRVTMETNALANYEKYYNNQSDSGRAAISVFSSLLKGGKGLGGAAGRSLSVKNTAEAFVKIGKCQSPTQQRFAENLLRRASEQMPLSGYVKARVIAQVAPPKLDVLPSDLKRALVIKAVNQKPDVVWFTENQAYEFPGLLALDNVATDFLLVKLLDKELTKETWESMLISRWQYDVYEKNEKNLVGGRFFSRESSQHQPTIERVDKYLPEFQNWMRERAVSLPDRFTLLMNVRVLPYGSEFDVRPQLQGCSIPTDNQAFYTKQQAYLKELAAESYQARQYCQTKNRPNLRAYNKCLRTSDQLTCGNQAQEKLLACIDKKVVSSELSPITFDGLGSTLNKQACGGSSAMIRNQPQKLYSEQNVIKSLPASHVNVQLAFESDISMPKVDRETFDQQQSNATLTFTVEITGADILPRAAGEEIAEINLKLDSKVVNAQYQFSPVPQKRQRRRRF